MGKTATIKLIPVIELEPSRYSKNEYKRPAKSGAEDPEGWEAYNQSSYRDSGLVDIKAIETGSWLFELEKLSNESLKIILENMYDDKLNTGSSTLEEILADMDNFSPLISGGFVLNVNEKNITFPGCCCGLESIRDWNSVFENPKGEVWNGHDCQQINYVVEGKELKIKVDGEYTYLTTMENFTEALENATKIINDFIGKSSGMLNEILKIENGYDLAKSMIYK